MTIDEARKNLIAFAYSEAENIPLAVAQSLDTVIKAVERTRWIPVSERLPIPEEEVLVTAVSKYGRIEIVPAIYEDGTMLENDSIWNWEELDGEWDEENECQIIPEAWWENRKYNPDCTYNCIIDDKVVAWMPLPDPYHITNPGKKVGDSND